MLSTIPFIIYLIRNNKIMCMKSIFEIDTDGFKFIVTSLIDLIISCNNDVTTLALEMNIIKKIES